MKGIYICTLNKTSMFIVSDKNILYFNFPAFFRYEKLQRWDDALKAYTVKASQVSSPHLVLEATLGLL
jgi:hypothetical protein